jgi:hypothetical protein
VGLDRDLAREQRSFLRRNRSGWDGHLEHIRAFLGEGLQMAAAQGPAAILGAGSGLEVPWALAPPGTVGWDADPWSRCRTALRHRRWPPWVFADLTGGMDAFSAMLLRGTQQTWSGRKRAKTKAIARVTGLLKTLEPQPEPLRAWIGRHRPRTILVANVMGQFGVVAQRAVEKAFSPADPWSVDPDLPDPLADAVHAWTVQAVTAFLRVLHESGADLWLCHDRGVVFGQAVVTLGPMVDPWPAQLRSPFPLEVSDPLCGVDVLQAFSGRQVERHQRWLWHLGPGQVHVMEALRVTGLG